MSFRACLHYLHVVCISHIGRLCCGTSIPQTSVAGREGPLPAQLHVRGGWAGCPGAQEGAGSISHRKCKRSVHTGSWIPSSIHILLPKAGHTATHPAGSLGQCPGLGGPVWVASTRKPHAEDTSFPGWWGDSASPTRVPTQGIPKVLVSQGGPSGQPPVHTSYHQTPPRGLWSRVWSFRGCRCPWALLPKCSPLSPTLGGFL